MYVAVVCCAFLAAGHGSFAQEDKKTDDDKPADPDTGESTVEDKAFGLCHNLWNACPNRPLAVADERSPQDCCYEK
jgi:hypothetical protein